MKIFLNHFQRLSVAVKFLLVGVLLWEKKGGYLHSQSGRTVAKWVKE